MGITSWVIDRRDSVSAPTVIDQLVRIYFDKEPWHKVKLSEVEARKYFQKVWETGNILIHSVGDLVVGYVEELGSRQREVREDKQWDILGV